MEHWTSDVGDNVENYMEYSYCNKMFTSGQKNRMRATLMSGVEEGAMLCLHQINSNWIKYNTIFMC